MLIIPAPSWKFAPLFRGFAALASRQSFGKTGLPRRWTADSTIDLSEPCSGYRFSIDAIALGATMR
jgi:hypothetical protein